VVSFDDATATDNCSATVTLDEGSLASGAVFPVGETMVGFTVVDPAGNEVGCMFTVTVVDAEDPTLPELQNITVTTEGAAECPAVATVDLEMGDTFDGGELFLIGVNEFEVPTPSDNCGANVTVTNVAIEGDACSRSFTISWMAADEAGNNVSASQTFTLEDDTAPVITLEGEATVYICQDGTYEELGATALDNCAGDISQDINIDDSSLDITTNGSYEVVYSVADACGNNATNVIRTVIVNPVPVVDPLEDVTVCFGEETEIITFGTDVEGTTFSYMVSGDEIGVPADEGAGAIPPFSPVNNGTTAATATIAVTPSFTVGGVTCVGEAVMFTITVEPEIDYSLTIISPDEVTLDADNTDYTATFCGGTTFAALDATATPVGSEGPLWIQVVINDPLDALGFGPGESTLYAPAGSFDFEDVLQNNSGSVVMISGAITPYFESEPVLDEITGQPLGTIEGECTGETLTFNLELDPKPIATVSGPEESVCSDEEFTFEFTETTGASDVTFAWSVTNEELPEGVTVNAASMMGNAENISVTNVSGEPQTITFEVIASTPDCDSDPVGFSLDVDPEPVIEITVSTPVVCSGDDVFVEFAETSGIEVETEFVWEIVSGLSDEVTANLTSGTGNIDELQLSNVGGSVATIMFTVDATSGACAGDQQTFSVIVNPEPVGDDEGVSGCSVIELDIDLQTLIDNRVASTFSWYFVGSSNALLVGQDSGTDVDNPSTSSTLMATAVNNSTQPQTATYRVTPTSADGDCLGNSFDVIVSLFGDVTVFFSTPDGTTVCAGDSIQLQGLPSGGSGPYSFNYAVTPLTGTAAGSFGEQDNGLVEFRGTGEGTVEVSLTVTDANNCTSEPFMLSLNVVAAPEAQAIVGDELVCPGTPSTYSVEPIDGITYNWSLSSGGNLLSSNSGSSVTIGWLDFEGGPHTLTLTQTNGNCEVTSTFEVNTLDVDADFTFLVDADDASGLTYDFTDASDQATAWSWDFGGVGASADQNPSFTFPGSGTYNVCLMVDGECGMADVCMDVVVTFTPVATCDTILLVDGINFISLDVAPVDAMVTSIFSDQIADGVIRSVQGRDDNGNAISYSPGRPPFLNSLQTLEPGRGYVVNAMGSDSLFVCGLSIDPEFRIGLNEGINLVAYVPQAPISVTDYFSDLIASGNLRSVRTYQDGGYVSFSPGRPPFLNSLSTMENGFGYEISVVDPVNEGEWATMTNVSVDKDIDELQATAEYIIASFETNITENTGELVYVTDVDGNRFAQAELLDEGYVVATPIYLNNANVELSIGTELYLEFAKQRVPLGISFTSDKADHHLSVAFDLKPEATEEVLEYDLELFPNPFTEELKVKLKLPEVAKVSVTILDINGRTVASLAKEMELTAGQHSFEFAEPNLPAGEYVLLVTTDGVRLFNERVIRIK